MCTEDILASIGSTNENLPASAQQLRLSLISKPLKRSRNCPRTAELQRTEA